MVDLETSEPSERDTSAAEQGFSTPGFLMMRGGGGGRAAITPDNCEEAETVAAASLEEQMGIEMVRLDRLAATLA